MRKSNFGEEDNITLLAKGVRLKGEIRVEGTVRIDGLLEGEIRTEGTVIIGEEGIVKGTIHAGVLINSGKIQATVTVSEKLQLLKSGLLFGEVHAPVFAIEEGGQFQGVSDMGAKHWEEKQQVPATIQQLPSHRVKMPVLIEKESDF